MSKDLCLRCGKCCYYPYAGKMKKCKYLDENNLCIIYETRLSTIIDITPEGNKVMCRTREQNKDWIPGCPYNKTIWLRNKR